MVKVVEIGKLIGLGYFAPGLTQAGETELDEVRGFRNISRVAVSASVRTRV